MGRNDYRNNPKSISSDEQIPRRVLQHESKIKKFLEFLGDIQSNIHKINEQRNRQEDKITANQIHVKTKLPVPQRLKITFLIAHQTQRLPVKNNQTPFKPNPHLRKRSNLRLIV